MKNQTKKAAQKIEAKHHQWTFEIQGKYNPSGISNFFGKLKDEGGRVIVTIRENEDYNQISRLLMTSKYLTSIRDMRGLARWAWDRGLVQMNKEEKEKWNKKKIVPLDIKEVLI
jgi:hypothetical protein